MSRNDWHVEHLEIDIPPAQHMRGFETFWRSNRVDCRWHNTPRNTRKKICDENMIHTCDGYCAVYICVPHTSNLNKPTLQHELTYQAQHIHKSYRWSCQLLHRTSVFGKHFNQGKYFFPSRYFVWTWPHHSWFPLYYQAQFSRATSRGTK